MTRPFRLRQPEPPENAVQDAILGFLRWDRRVAWAHRFNTGAQVIRGQDAMGRETRRFVRYAFPGCADILGQLVDGRFLAVECKTPHGRATPAQQAFIARVNAARGLGVIARSVDDVQAALDAVFERPAAASTSTFAEGRCA